MLLSEILPRVAQLQPDRAAMKDSAGTISYGQLMQRVSCLAQGFRNHAIKPGDRVALLGHPSPQLAIAECAAIAIGAIPFAIYPGLARNEIIQILQDADPIAIVYDSEDEHLTACASALPDAIAVPCRTIERYIETHSPLTEWHKANPDDVALMIYTGGTTGRSKGVMHSHRSIGSWSFMNPERGGGHNPDKRTLISNQAHLSGQFMLWTTLYEGGCLIYTESYPLQAETMIELIEREELKYIGTIGLQFKDIAQLLAERGKSLPHVLGISCGGAPISERTFHLARQAFPNAQLTNVYAQTESGQFISPLFINACFAEGFRHRLLSVGNPAHVARWGQKPFQVRIVDEDGRDVGPGGIGEVICRGDQLMLGYWNNPEETNKALRGGWLYTGDIGTFDDDGYLYLLDRKKDLVIVGGSNVYCSEVEEVLARHPAIAEVAVVGAPLPDEGEEVTAVVVLREGAGLTLADIKAFCRDHLASHKIPSRLDFAESLPRTSFGKLNKPEIRKPYWLGRPRMIR